jgi:hypothetical protein
MRIIEAVPVGCENFSGFGVETQLEVTPAHVKVNPDQHRGVKLFSLDSQNGWKMSWNGNEWPCQGAGPEEDATSVYGYTGTLRADIQDELQGEGWFRV